MKLNASFCALVILGIVTLACDRIAMRIEHQGDKAIVHMETLGEYPTTVKQIQIVDGETKAVIVNWVAVDHAVQIYKITLGSGKNLAPKCFPETDGFRTLPHAAAGEFTLLKGRTYLVRMWGKSSRPVEATFAF